MEANPNPLAVLEQAVQEGVKHAMPGLFAEIIAAFADETEESIEQLKLAYRVALARYVRMKILVKRRLRNLESYSADYIPSYYWSSLGAVSAVTTWEAVHLAMYRHQEEKNTIQSRLLSLGVQAWQLRLIRQGRWF